MHKNAQQTRSYKAWDKDGLGEEKMVAAIKLVLGEEKLSVRAACRRVFGEKFPNIYRTVGNLYKRHFKESIGLAKNLSQKTRKLRIEQLDAEWIQMGQPGNPNWKPYLTPDEEELIVCFLQTCNFMHMPFNRDAFKASLPNLISRI